MGLLCSFPRWSYQGETYNTRVAFQVFISPDAYEVGPETIGAKSKIDPQFSNSDIEWFTNQQGSTILYGLLIKVEDPGKRACRTRLELSQCAS